jgi:hypothetical protein
MDPWNPTTTQGNAAGASTSIHAPQQQPAFSSSSTAFGLASGASAQHPLQTIREQDDDEEYETFSETRGRRSSMAHHREPSEEVEIPQGADGLTTTIARILNQQVEINRQLMNNKGASLPVQLPYFHGRANENVQTWLFQVDQVFKPKRSSKVKRCTM